MIITRPRHSPEAGMPLAFFFFPVLPPGRSGPVGPEPGHSPFFSFSSVLLPGGSGPEGSETGNHGRIVP